MCHPLPRPAREPSVHFRAIAMRYDKLAKIFLAGVQLACAAILLN